MHNQFILIGTKNDADWLGVPFRIHLLTVVIQIEVHLPDIFMLNLSTFQVDQNKALQNPMVENQIDLIYPSANHHFLLSSYICETFSKFQKKHAQVIDKCFFQVTFLINRKLRQSSELKNIRFL